jgi:Arc/MetJ family transcription regulator
MMMDDWRLMMRTTLSIDDDVLEAAKVLATKLRVSLGEVVSDLARQSLRRPSGFSERNGIPLLPVSKRGAQVTLAQVNELRDEMA